MHRAFFNNQTTLSTWIIQTTSQIQLPKNKQLPPEHNKKTHAHTTKTKTTTITTHNLQLDSLSLQLNGPNLKINTNGTDVAFGVRVVCETKEKTRFADSRVANEKKFEEVVAVPDEIRMKRLVLVWRMNDYRGKTQDN